MTRIRTNHAIRNKPMSIAVAAKHSFQYLNVVSAQRELHQLGHAAQLRGHLVKRRRAEK